MKGEGRRGRYQTHFRSWEADPRKQTCKPAAGRAANKPSSQLRVPGNLRSGGWCRALLDVEANQRRNIISEIRSCRLSPDQELLGTCPLFHLSGDWRRGWGRGGEDLWPGRCQAMRWRPLATDAGCGAERGDYNLCPTLS